MHEYLNPDQLEKLRNLGDVNEGISDNERERLNGIYSKLIAEGNPTARLDNKKPLERAYPTGTYLKLNEKGNRYDIDSVLVSQHHGPIVERALKRAIDTNNQIWMDTTFLNIYANQPGMNVTDETRAKAEGFIAINQQIFAAYRNFLSPYVNVDELLVMQASQNAILETNTNNHE